MTILIFLIWHYLKNILGGLNKMEVTQASLN